VSENNYLGITSVVESQRLEKQADEILRQAAADEGAIRDPVGKEKRLGRGRGYTAWARAQGILSRKRVEVAYRHEAVGFEPAQLESLAGAAPFVRPDSAGPSLPGWRIDGEE
jgi:hypothetical protein